MTGLEQEQQSAAEDKVAVDLNFFEERTDRQSEEAVTARWTAPAVNFKSSFVSHRCHEGCSREQTGLVLIDQDSTRRASVGLMLLEQQAELLGAANSFAATGVRNKYMEATLVSTVDEQKAGSEDARAGKYLTFHLGDEEFGVQVEKVREIMGVQDITAVPQTPDFVRGVINLRGKVIPVVDLRLKFGIEEMEYTQRTCIIVLQVRGESVSMLMGIIVDGVSEVLNLGGTEIEDTPDFGQGVATTYLLGMAKVKGKVKILLDIDQVLGEKGTLEGLEGIMA